MRAAWRRAARMKARPARANGMERAITVPISAIRTATRSMSRIAAICCPSESRSSIPVASKELDMKLKLWQIDAFTETVFGGNPAGVVPLDHWIDAKVMQAIAMENNQAETAFFAPNASGSFDLRWFKPTSEVD